MTTQTIKQTTNQSTSEVTLYQIPTASAGAVPIPSQTEEFKILKIESMNKKNW